MSDLSPGELLANQLYDATVSAFDLGSVYLGLRLGYYQALRDLGHANAGELASAARASARYTREWLEHQAVSGLISVCEQSASPDGRRYSLTPGTEELLTDTIGKQSTIHDVRCAIASLLAADDVSQCFRNGTGLPFSHFGEQMRIGQELSTRRGFVEDLGTVWLPAMPDLHAHLSANDGARIADIGAGAGWSTIALARAYPNARVDGLDLDPASAELARANALAEGVNDRVTFKVQDASDPALTGHYDLACAFECIHDMTQPVPVLRAMRSLVGLGGTVFIGDLLVPDEFSAPGGPGERLDYGYSLFHCLPVGMDSELAVGTGAIMRQSTFRSYAAAAGFTQVEIVPIDHPSWRFYRLTG